VRDGLRQVEAFRLARECELRRVASCLRHRFAHAVFETHRHHPAGADSGRGEERTPISPLDAARIVRIAQLGGEPRAVRRFGECDRPADAGERGVLLDHPACAIVPPAHRREPTVDACAFESGKIAAGEAGRSGEKAHVGMSRTHGVVQLPPDLHGHTMRRIEAKTADTRRGEREQLLRPPVGERGTRAGIAEVGIRDVVLAMHMARIESRFFRFKRMEPVRMLGVKRAIGGDAVNHEIRQQGEAVRTRLAGECADGVAGGLLGFEHRMQARVVADHLAMARAPRLEETADQRVIEAERGRMSELRRPRVKGPNQK